MADFPGVGRVRCDKWRVAYQEHVYISRKAASSNRKSIFIGDSLVKNFCRGSAAAIFDEHYPDHLNFGIGGDKVENIHYRVKHNGIPKSVHDVIILVGTNNLAAHHLPSSIAKAIVNLADCIDKTVDVHGLYSYRQFYHVMIDLETLFLL